MDDLNPTGTEPSQQQQQEHRYLDPWEFRSIYQQLHHFGEGCSPRGQPIKELVNFNWTFPAYVRWINFDDRKLSLTYIKAELQWYLKGDPYDLSIANHAKLWGKLADADGKLNSNYGHLLFRQGGIAWAIEQLKADRDSRRACVMILRSDQLKLDALDVPCTYALNFLIRKNKLLASIHMRSQDAVWGLGNDLPFFSIVQELVATMLGIQMGPLHLSVDSFHTYERHWDMVGKIADHVTGSPWCPIECPRLTNEHEARCLLTNTPDMSYPLTRWIYE